jgi:hypothetical protein
MKRKRHKKLKMSKSAIATRRRRRYRARKRYKKRTFAASPTKKKEWVFDWAGGGYNSVFAGNRREALEKARAMEKEVNRPRRYQPGGGPIRKLVLLEDTLHIETPGELARRSADYD